MNKVPSYAPPSVKLVSALDIALQCTLAKLPEPLLIAAIAELAEYRKKIAFYENRTEKIGATTMHILIAAFVFLLVVFLIILTVWFKDDIYHSPIP
jgi:hypothetical protein